MGEVLASGEKKDIMEKINQLSLYSGTSNKLNYTLWNFSSAYEEVLGELQSAGLRNRLNQLYSLRRHRSSAG